MSLGVKARKRTKLLLIRTNIFNTLVCIFFFFFCSFLFFFFAPIYLKWTTFSSFSPQHKCGVCGDPADGVRENEAGGKYAQGIITRHYHKGQIITVDVELTANHHGHMTFKLCRNNNFHKAITNECLDKHPLKLADGSGTKYMVKTSRKGHFKIDLKLPDDLTCTQCVLQWVYHSG